MKRRTICLSDKQDIEFHRLVKEQGLRFSELIRRALDEYLEKQKYREFMRSTLLAEKDYGITASFEKGIETLIWR